ncbi:hypothetical protein LC605_23765 [Nostoc sp. CHAB 5836]|nr:hypothetical protein [Nostoc sp. CHAB 5836]
MTSQLATLSVTEILPVQISSKMKVRDVIKRVEADGWYLDRSDILLHCTVLSTV